VVHRATIHRSGRTAPRVLLACRQAGLGVQWRTRRDLVATNRHRAVSVDARDGLPPPGIVETSLLDAVFLLFDLEPLQGAPCDVG
jgi:hypothetical protein